MENYLLAIDIGTSSTKGLAVQPNGAVLADFQQAYPTHYPQPGYAEQDPDTVLEAVAQVIAETIRRTPSADLAGIVFSCAMHSLMAVDERGKPLTPVITWADTRSRKEAEILRKSELGKAIYHESGTPIHPMSPLCKLLWMKTHLPELFLAAYKFISIKEYVVAKLTGEYLVDYSLASATGLFNIHQLTWSSTALRLLDLEGGKLSRLVSPYYSIAGLKPELASRFNISGKTPLILGANDGCLAQLGCGAMNSGDLSITIGTSGAARMASSSYRHDEKSRIFNYRLDEKTFIAGGATNNGAVLLSWFEENIERKKPNSEVFVEEAFSVPGSDGLIFLPYLLGERAPMYDPLARGVFFGIHIQHHSAHFKRAILEGICFELKSIVNAVEEVVHPIERVIASGGFVKSDAWVQLLSDILGKPVTVNSQSDASALGAAIQGFQALGISADFQQPGEEKLFQPDEKRFLKYQKLFELASTLYDKLKDDFIKLNDSCKSD